MAALGACLGTIGEPGSPPPDPGRHDGGRSDGGAVVPEVPAPSTRFARLSHAQWENATRDLLGLPEPSGLSHGFLGDATRSRFDNNTVDLRVGATLWQQYQIAAETLAERAAATPEALARVVPADLAGDASARARGFVASFGRRAFRRPLTDDEVARYAALFARGAEIYPEAEPFAAGVRLTIAAMLQSPHFLYRIETSTARDGDVVTLSNWEIATRLSFALWNTTPDAELLRAAEAGELTRPEGLRGQVRRMLADPHVRDVVDDFHEQLLETERYADVTRPTEVFPEFSPELRASMAGETREFVRHVVFGERAGLEALLTAPYTFVDARLARVYGLEGTFPADAFVRAPLDPARRAGLLTQIGFLATNASGAETDPIHRGVFVNLRVLCARLPPPPPNVPPLPPPMGMVTMRQRIDAHTGPGTCGASCHGTMINPIGFAYEHYDALGRWRELDNGLRVDATGSYMFEGGAARFDGAVELARAMVAQPQVHTCYTGHWLEFAYGREVTRGDRPLIDRLGAASLGARLPVLDLIAELVTSRAFVTRAPQELDL